MSGTWRTGRAAAWIAVPAALALVAGVHLGGSALGLASRPVSGDRMKELEAQGRAMVESFWASLDSLRWQAVALRQLQGAESGQQSMGQQSMGKILHWAEMEIQAAKAGQAEIIGPVLRSVRNRNRPVGTSGAQGDVILSDAFFNDNYVPTLPSLLSLRELRDNGVTLARVRPDPQRGKEWLALGFSPPQARHRVLAVLVDPVEAFSFLTRLASKGDPAGLRAYLIAGDGKVLAHSVAPHVGSTFVNVPVFRDAVRGLILGLRTSGAGEYGAIDRLPVTAAYERPGSLPLGMVVERVEPSKALSMERVIEVWDRIAGVAGAWAGALLLAVLAAACLLGRKLPAPEASSPGALDEGFTSELLGFAEPPAEAPVQTGADPSTAIEAEPAPPDGESEPEARVVFQVPAALAPALERESELQALRRDLRSSQEALKNARTESALLHQFESESARLRDPREVAARLAQTASRLCSSPTLYFAFHESARVAVLQSTSGFEATEEPSGMSFAFDAPIQHRIFECEKKGQIASLSDYGPLAKLCLARFGTAHFEAWPVTGFAHLGRQAERPKLLGVLVVLHAGVESRTRQDSLFRMMRATGLIYENSILAQQP